ncbi:L-threonylcarbamoyladenylate synthase [Mycoplasma leonicaptivi]|uniref:L-threonylcarbamoyladenylate synthase n=1 Tax=Mycoplasma leonicaptivi TaxID=36742 RepID=UPI000489B037|nr:L-threonylcarbamoyladenylate synthase [Mycoplasma leonicaptivi]
MENKFKDLILCTTDTVPGIGGVVNDNVLDLIYEIKQRPLNKKIVILVASIEQASSFEQWTKQASEVAKKYWPGGFTIVVNNQGFRMPDNQALLNYLNKNGPIYLTSANISGQNPLNFEEAKKVFYNVGNILDFGTGSGKPSTIINLDTNQIIER